MPATATKSAKSPAKNGKAAAKAPAPAVPAPIDPRTVRAAAQTLKQAGDPVRLTVLLMLADGEKNVGEMAAILQTPQNALSYHLAIMRHSRLIETRRSGKSTYYAPTDSGRRLVEAVRGLV